MLFVNIIAERKIILIISNISNIEPSKDRILTSLEYNNYPLNIKGIVAIYNYDNLKSI